MGKDATLENGLGHRHGLACLADDDRQNLRAGRAQRIAERTEAVCQLPGVGPQLLSPLGFPLYNIECGEHRRRHRRRNCRGIDETPRPIHQPVNQRMTAGHKGPYAAQRLAQGAHLDIDLSGQAEFFNQTAAVRPEHAGCVGLINHHPGVVLLGQADNLRQRSQVAVHAEHAVRYDQAPAGGRACLQQFAEMRRVSVTIDPSIRP